MSAARARTGAASALWRALRRGRRRGAPRTSVLLRALPRLVTATLSGRYRGLSRGRLLAMVAAALYVLSPVDVLPEGLLGPLGLADDAAVMAWLAGALLSEGEAFLAWEREGRPAGASSPGSSAGAGAQDGGRRGSEGGSGRGRGDGRGDGPGRGPEHDVVTGEVIR